mmetsp:Transcript_7608/g.16355  ORF Transcript_7608/g.16355 Transcript_7608/m.16355 type:complete len:269 (+) Transcript_7608:56-862(+)
MLAMQKIVGSRTAKALGQPWRRYFAASLPEVQMFQYHICPFCCKVKAFMDWKKIPYKVMDVNPITKKEIKFSPDYRKVPIVKLGEEQINDSPVILREIIERGVKGGDLPEKLLEQVKSDEVQKWLKFCDTKLAVLMFPNLTRNFSESFEAFGYVNDVPHFSGMEKIQNRIVGSVAMWLANGKLKKKYNIVDERADLLAAFKEWTDAVGGKPFVFGDELSLADVAVYGVLNSIKGFQSHTWMMSQSEPLAAWDSRVRAAIGPSAMVSRE